jgi:hypothetical protein
VLSFRSEVTAPLKRVDHCEDIGMIIQTAPAGQPRLAIMMYEHTALSNNLPRLTVSTHSTPSAHTPMGVKGCGEVGTIGSSAAVTNAVVSNNTARLDSWWIEKRWLDERIVARVGQFAGQDFYGVQERRCLVRSHPLPAR